MTKIDIFSGFLGAGKTTLIKKLIKESYTGEKLVLIENEFGEIGVDGGFLQDAGINITEMNSGCICCSLVGDFAKALKQVKEKYNPDRILIEPSGVGKLSDVIKAVEKAELTDCTLNSFTAVVDVNKCKMYLRNFGEFFEDQVKNANCIVLSHTGKADEDKVETIVHLLRLHNENAVIVTTDWDKLDGKALVEAMEKTDTLEEELKKLHEEHEHDDDEECSCGCGHHHHHDDDDAEHEHHHHYDENGICSCGHHHDDDDDEEHEHHHHYDENGVCSCGHHHDDDDDEEHEHHHHHDDEEECSCGCGHHHHDHEHHHGHHHHHADEIFTSWGKETAKKYSVEEIENILKQLENEDDYGTVLRAKGIVAGEGAFVHFDYVPEEIDVREGSAAVTGRICVIGCKLKEENLEKLFKI